MNERICHWVDLPVGAIHGDTADDHQPQTLGARINALAKKAKAEGLTPDEQAEQKKLREEYIAGFRASLRAQLDNTVVLNPDGTSYRLSPKGKKH